MNKIFSPEEEAKIRELCASGLYYHQDMVQFFENKTMQQIRTYCKKNKIFNNKKNFWSKEDEEKLEKLLKSGFYRFEDLPKEFPDKSISALKAKTRNMGLSNFHPPSKYVFDQYYFDKLTLTNCYMGGYFAADGNIMKIKNTWIFTMTVAEKDSCFIDFLKTEFKSTHKVRIYQHKSPHSDFIGSYHAFRIGGVTKWVDNLNKYFGIFPNKTKHFPPPALENMQQKLAYLKGYLDGDGCLNVSNNNFTIYIASSNKNILIWIKDLIDSFEIPSMIKNRKQNINLREDEQCYYYSMGGFKACILYELISRVNTKFCLNRKWLNPDVLRIINKAKLKSKWPREEFFQEILNRQ